MSPDLPAAHPAPPAGRVSDPENLFGRDREALRAALAPWSDRAYHAGQLFRWMYARRATDFEAMTDLPGALRSALRDRFRIDWPRIREVRESPSDGSKKYVLALEDGAEVESVYILYGRRVTLCLSSQVGCPLACRFCLTGTMGLVRNLEAGEILGQAAVLAQENGLAPGSFRVVFMGMGEPLNNYDAVMAAFRTLADPEGFGLAPRRITLSTVGLVPGIERLGGESPRPRLAISLGTARDDVRDDLMPINRKYPLEALIDACRRFPLAPRERVTFEYILLAGVNDGAADARRVAMLLRGVRGKVNLIPYNEAGVEGFHTPAPTTARRFRDALLAHGLPATIRWSKGRDIGAACGQLARGPLAVAPAPPIP
ncbi:MAG: 23S rRNA (adenine(2503)-C(2))-methyltransferase RlmN [Candidatus Polarisedimenticolia bacterium]